MDEQLLHFIDEHCVGLSVFGILVFWGICVGLGAIWNTFHSWLMKD
jgi:hypothetical protein